MPTAMPESLAEGRFRLLEVIGEGGMATVYRAFDQRLQRPRAIKVLSPTLALRPALRKRFLAEAQTMAGLEESRVVRVFDTGEDGDRVYIVMELVDGGSLLDRVRDFGPLPPRMAADAIIQICESLQAAHDAGVIHRDIKPHNILLTRAGEIRVTDFGIAQVQTEDGDGMTKTGAIMGTWGFMAPEQKTNAKQVDVRADVYSLGATLWSLLRAETPPELFMAEAEPGLLDDVPEELAEVIKRACRYRREDRYLSARAMAESLRALVPMLPEDPELAVPLVGHTLSRAGKPLDTMQQFVSEVRTGDDDVVGSPGTMVPSVGELDAAPMRAATPPPLSPRPGPAIAASPTFPETVAPRRTSVLPWLLGGAVLLGGFVVVVAVAAWLFWPVSDGTLPALGTVEAPVVAAPAEGTPIAAAPVPVPPTAPSEPAPSTGSTADSTTTGASAGRGPGKKVAAAPVAPTTSPIAAPTAPVVTPEATAPVAADPAPKKGGLVHDTPGAARVGESITFRATLPDAGWNVKLYYKPAAGGPFDNKPMAGADGAYTATVKVTDAMAGGVVYFISADKGETKLKAGSATGPKTVAIAP
ncbi:MAG: protein kinase [Pseudomonadota bacterium]|nr:protein kinase [Pseudomonadota bacterium]